MSRFLNIVLGIGVALAVGLWAYSLERATLRAATSWSPVEFAAQATVLVSDDGGHGSGVVIAPGVVLTAAHVVGTRETMKITLSNGVEKTGTVIWTSRGGYDYALLAVETGSILPASISCKAPYVGEPVFTFGYPLVVKKAAAWGRVSSIEPITEQGAMKSATVLDLTIVPGNSGGGVWNEHGELVGVADAVLLVPLGFTPSVSGLSIMTASPALCRTLGRVS